MMRKRAAVLLSLLVITGIILCSGCVSQRYDNGAAQNEKMGDGSVTITDMKGRQVVLSKPAERIVCTNGDSVVLLIVIGAGRSIIGAPNYNMGISYQVAQMPDAVAVGSGDTTDVEKIVTLNPDVVIVSTTASSAITDKLQGAHIPYVQIDGYKIADIPKEIEILGILTGHNEGAGKYQAFYSRNLDLINHRLADIPEEKRTTVYLEAMNAYSTVGNSSGGDSLIRMAYGKNIAGSIGSPWPVVSPEWILTEDPEVIIKIAYPGLLSNSTMQNIREEIVMRPSLNATRAVKNNRVYILNYQNTYNTQGITALVYLVKVFYPVQFTDINPDIVLQEYDREFLPGSMNTEPIYPKFV